jgi:hypothetical protein
MTTPEATSFAAAAAVPDVDQQVIELLQARKGEWKRIAEESQVVSYSWITKFMCGHIPGAKIDTLKTLRDWLVANPVASPASTAVGSGTPSHHPDAGSTSSA